MKNISVFLIETFNYLDFKWNFIMTVLVIPILKIFSRGLLEEKSKKI